MLRKHVLNRQKDFDLVYEKGKSAGSKYVVFLFRKNGRDITRISFLASKKVGNSVVRNRARRLMKEAFRLLKPDVPKGYDMVFIARQGISRVKCDEVMRSIRACIKRTGVFK